MHQLTLLNSKIVPLNLSSVISPDSYSVNGKRPTNTFVVSRDTGGNIISSYGDDFHDYTPYETRPHRQSIIYYSRLPTGLREDAKWLVFILIYMVDSGRCGMLSIGTVLNHFGLIAKQVRFSALNNITLLELLSSTKHVRNFVDTIRENKGSVQLLAAQLKFLFYLGEEKTGIRSLNKNTLQEISTLFARFPDDKQHPVIPPRLFSSIIKSLWLVIDDFEKHEKSIITFIDEAVKDRSYARSLETQRKNDLDNGYYQSTFIEACDEHNLSDFIKGMEISSIKMFSSYLTAIQITCKNLIHVYSGMRHSEALSLKTDCLRIEQADDGQVVRLIGITSKLIGLRKGAAWVTSKEAVIVVKVAQSIASIIGDYCKIDKKEMPLFPSTAHLPFNNSKSINTSKTVKLLNSLNGNKFLLKLVSNSDWKIQETDLKFLEELDPFRDWRNEDCFKLNHQWLLHSHQFRRSMSFYISQSGLVSLPSLKRQLKHINGEMSLYYSKGSGLVNKSLESLFAGDDHFKQELRDTKPEADSMAYLYQVLLSEEPLYGGFGEKIEKYSRQEWDRHINIEPKSDKSVELLDDRKKLEERFKKGEIAYAVTPLGACTTITPCNKKPLRLITACINCNNAILKSSKITNCVNSYEYFLDQLPHDSLEYRFEKIQLDELKELQNKLIPVKELTDVRIR